MNNQEIAQAILSQIEVGVRMSIGWRMRSGFYGEMYEGPSYAFDAKPRHRIRRVVITLNPDDLYNLRVVDIKTGKELHIVEGLYAFQLNRALLDLESNPGV